MPTVARILELAPTCCYLAANYKDNKKLFKGEVPTSALQQANLIYMYWKILNKIYTEDNNYAGLQAPANQLYELMQKFAFKAANIYDGGGGGSIAPITPRGSLPTPYYFEVSDSSFIANGQSTVTMPVSWSGYNLTFYRGGIIQSTLNTEASYFNYDTTTRILTISPAAVTSELFAIIPV